MSIALVLLVFVRVDPPTGVTASASPFTDEAWHVVNARNFVLFGRWSTDDYNLHLITAPFSIAVAAAFTTLGLGIAQARVVAILATGATVGLLAVGLRSTVGRWPALAAGVAYGTSALVLYYGRLAFLEPLEALFLVGALLLAIRGDQRHRLILGLLAGTALALAIGTKASAIVPAGGVVAGLIVMGIRDPGARRWLIGCLAGIVLGGLGWLIVVGLPNLRDLPAVLSTLPPEPLPGSPAELLKRVAEYVVRSDGAWPLAAPLIVGSLVGGVAGVTRWSRLNGPQRRLLLVATGWVVAGFGILFLIAYRPNRYVVPMLPALAAMVGLGLAVVAESEIRGRIPRIARAVVAVLAIGGLVAPGLILDARWMATTPSTMPAVQERIAGLVPAAATIQGDYAPLLAMTAQVTTVVVWPGGRVNAGDLYSNRGVRWVVGVPGRVTDVPSWVRLHPTAWAARRMVACQPWDGVQVCLWALP